MPNVTNKLLMSDNTTLCDIFAWYLDLTGIDLSLLDSPQMFTGIKTAISEIIAFSTTTMIDRPVFIRGLKYGETTARTYTTTTSCNLRYGRDAGEDTDKIVLVYIDIPGYTLEVYNNEGIVVRKNNTNLSYTVRSDVSITQAELIRIINIMKSGGELIYFNINNYFNIKCNYWLYVPQGGAPVPVTIEKWFNDSTLIGSLTMVYIYWSGPSNKSEGTVVFTRNSTGDITINVQAPHS